MTNSQAIAGTGRVSRIDDAIRTVEAPFRRFAWYLRTSGIVERTSMRILGAAVLIGAAASIVWLATSFFVAL